MLITNNRIVLLEKKTRDVETQTVPLSKIASVGVRSDYGAWALVGGIFFLLFGFGCLVASFSLINRGSDSTFGFLFFSGCGVLGITHGIISIVTRIATIIEVESFGGSTKIFESSGSNQKNKITSAIEHLNALMMDA